MRPRGSLRLVLVIAALAGSGWVGQASAPRDRPDVISLVSRVGERVAAYYSRAQQLICLERSTVVPINSDWSVQGFSRMVESELRVELDAADGDGRSEAHVTREIRRINGREPRERDRTDRSGCTDPTPVSPEPLAFLLSGQRDDYRFTAVHEAHEHGRAALVIDFSSALKKSDPVLIEDEHGHSDCFDWKGPIAIAGRLWIDAATYDVLRLDRHLAGPTDVHVPWALGRRYHFDQWLTLQRDDLMLRYKEVSFSDPEEKVLLPESSEATTVFRTGLQSVRRSEEFSDYRRFLTDSRIIKGR